MQNPSPISSEPAAGAAHAWRSVLITGGSGFLAHGLAQRLLEGGCKRVCLFSRAEFAQARMRRAFNDDPRLRWLIGDVRDEARVARAMQGVELVIHAAALKRIEVGIYCPDEVAKTNVVGTMNVISAARASSVERVLLVSSDKAFEPISPYGYTKALAEYLMLQENDLTTHGPRYAVVRYGNVFGSTGSVVPTWRELLANGASEVPVTDPDCSRFFMRLSEAVDLVLDTATRMHGGEIAVPQLPAYRVGELAEAMEVRMRVIGLRPHEKKDESLSVGNSSDRARRMSVDELKVELSRV